MRARCFRCQNTFDTERFGTQTCPSCGSEIYLPDPSAPPPPAAGPQPETPPPPAGAAGWGPPPPGWTAPPGPPPGWAPLPPGAVPPPAEQSAPFAERARRGFVPAFVETWKLAAVEPARFFRQVRVSETGSAALAVLGPILLVCLCACAAGAILGIAGVSGLGGGMGGTPPSTGI